MFNIEIDTKRGNENLTVRMPKSSGASTVSSENPSVALSDESNRSAVVEETFSVRDRINMLKGTFGESMDKSGEKENVPRKKKSSTISIESSLSLVANENNKPSNDPKPNTETVDKPLWSEPENSPVEDKCTELPLESFVAKETVTPPGVEKEVSQKDIEIETDKGADEVSIKNESNGMKETINGDKLQEPPQQYNNSNDSHAGTQYQRFQEDPYRKPAAQPQQQFTVKPQQPPQQAPTTRITVQSKAPEVKATPPAAPPAPPPPPAAPPAPALAAPPPAPPAPPAPPSVGGAPPPPPPPPPPPSSGGGPPPPPPPPAPPSGGGGGGGDNGLANALAGVQLKKRSAEPPASRPAPAAAPMDDMMSALNKKLQARKQKTDNEDTASSGPVRNTPSPSTNKAAPTFNKNTIPFNKNKSPNTQNNKANTSLSPRSPSVSGSMSADELKTLKEEILSNMKQELHAVKNEIIEAMRQEISKLSNN